MFEFLKSLFSGPSRPPQSNPWEELESVGADSSPPQIVRALRTLELDGALDMARARRAVEVLYERWPAEVQSHAFEITIDDPFAAEIDDLFRSEEPLQLWESTPLIRTVGILSDGPGPFHHGFSAADLRGVFEAPNAPSPEALHISTMVDWTAADVEALVDHLGDRSEMAQLRHLALPTGGFEPRDLARLAQSETAQSLESLDLCEVLVDRPDEDVARVVSELHRFESLAHLNMYNDFHGVAQVEALASTRLPKLTHLSLGTLGVDDDVVLALVDGGAFPSLDWLYLGGVSPELGEALEARGIRTEI